MGLESTVSSPNEVWGEAPAANDFSAFSTGKNDAGDIYLYFRKLRNEMYCCSQLLLTRRMATANKTEKIRRNNSAGA